ncbi:hypothetical protein EJ377_01625 [Chryseobacterium arthrosphaerae]|uniref:DUF8202 domain-containing protein n=1 Tax=Chryseobacterium arthrosphaerae TaxID=651561 RepID=A0A432DYH3_9FLAO|nr:hypothetical protein EJ377_01625 [Chryseobacterium arthrosphaerae]
MYCQDNTSDLHQKQSQSINDGQKLIIGAGNSLANTILTIPFPDRRQFLMTVTTVLTILNTPLVYTSEQTERPTIVLKPSGRFRYQWRGNRDGSMLKG